MESQTIMMGYTTPPSIDDICVIAEEIIDELPNGIEKYIGKLEVVVEDFPDDYIMSELELDSPYDIFGVYQSAGPKSFGRTVGNTNKQDQIYLYRRPILDAWCETCDDFGMMLNRIILQEIGYHFGFTDDEIDMFEEEMTPDDQIIVCE